MTLWIVSQATHPNIVDAGGGSRNVRLLLREVDVAPACHARTRHESLQACLDDLTVGLNTALSLVIVLSREGASRGGVIRGRNFLAIAVDFTCGS